MLSKLRAIASTKWQENSDILATATGWVLLSKERVQPSTSDIFSNFSQMGINMKILKKDIFSHFEEIHSPKMFGP